MKLKKDNLMEDSDRNMSEKDRIEKLKKIANYVRTKTLETILNANNGHLGGNMSSVELLTVLYFSGIFNFDPENPKNSNRDRVLIRGHEGPLRYTIFSLLNYIDKEELNTYRMFGSRLQGHEDMKITPGVDITPSGSLGMLLSYGVGFAIANKDKGISAKTIVFLGDGEEQEGNVEEAARHATTLNLNNLICILDKNSKQLSRSTEESDGHDIKKIWEGYGWNVLEIKNGNDIEQVLEVYKQLSKINSPTMVIANTVKGYGIKGAKEHYSGYHTLSSTNDKENIIRCYNKMKELLKKDSINSEIISKYALDMVSKPKIYISDHQKISSNIFDIRTNVSNISPQVAHENYLKELRKKIGEKDALEMYYITPDLYRKPEVEELEFEKFMHFIDTGIREQHAIAMSHGISIENPNARICLCFGEAFIYRALDQINAVGMGESNMTILGVWPGIQGAQNGRTHQTVSQPIALMGIPELNFYEPGDAIDLYNIFSKVFTENNGLNYIRLSKESISLERNKSDEHNIGSYFVYKASDYPDLLIISSGFTLQNCVKTAKQLELEYNILANVINVVNLKKFYQDAPFLIVNDAPIMLVYNGSPKVLSHYITNSIISNPDIPRPKAFLSHGFEVGTTGKMNDLINYYGFDEESLKYKSLKLVKSKK